jgi:hypothetical protein
MTGGSVIGCDTLSGALACKANERLVCKPKKHRHDHDRHDNDKDDDDDDKGHHRNPFGSKHDNDSKPGDKGRMGSYK